MKYFSMFSGIGGFEYGIQNCRELLQGKTSEGLRDMPDTKKRQNRATCVGL